MAVPVCNLSLREAPGREGPALNLITCYPFYYVGSAPKRFVVEAGLAGSVSVAPAAHATVKNGS
jgi:sortase (surface protein transpeptidase)